MNRYTVLWQIILALIPLFVGMIAVYVHISNQLSILTTKISYLEKILEQCQLY
jgi:hypothetical protein